VSSTPYQDDPAGVPPGSMLIRLVSPHFVDWADGSPTLTTQAVQFYDQVRAEKAGCPAPALSVIVERLVSDRHALVARYAAFGLAALSVDVVRTSECGVQLWPTDDEPAHAVVFRKDGGATLSGSARKTWRDALNDGWIAHPPRVS
jgi:hypothetical protein